MNDNTNNQNDVDDNLVNDFLQNDSDTDTESPSSNSNTQNEQTGVPSAPEQEPPSNDLQSAASRNKNICKIIIVNMIIFLIFNRADVGSNEYNSIQ